MAVVLLGAAGLLSGCGGSRGSTHSVAVKGPSEVAAAPVSSTGANPFTASVGKDTHGVKPPAAAGSSTGGAATYSGDLPGLYGGTRNYATCDADKLVAFLEQNPAKAAAWAGTLGIQTTEIRDYVSRLTPVVLRTDSRVTNHGYVEGQANPIQSLLEAGTAVFVDRHGQPVVKCYCGNPLTAPVLYASPTYVGPLWTTFSPTRITIIHESTTIIKIFTLYDPANGTLFTRTAGAHGRDGPYKGTSTRTTTQPPPTSTTPQPPPTSTTPQPPPTTTGNSSTPTQTATSPATTVEKPSVSLSPNPVIQGGTVTLTASGFAPGSTLQITVDRPDGGVDHFSTSAGGDGTGTYTFTNAGGNVSLGTYSVTVTNPATGAQASASIAVVAPPTSATSTEATNT